MFRVLTCANTSVIPNGSVHVAGVSERPLRPSTGCQASITQRLAVHIQGISVRPLGRLTGSPTSDVGRILIYIHRIPTGKHWGFRCGHPSVIAGGVGPRGERTNMTTVGRESQPYGCLLGGSRRPSVRTNRRVGGLPKPQHEFRRLGHSPMRGCKHSSLSGVVSLRSFHPLQFHEKRRALSLARFKPDFSVEAIYRPTDY